MKYVKLMRKSEKKAVYAMLFSKDEKGWMKKMFQAIKWLFVFENLSFLTVAYAW